MIFVYVAPDSNELQVSVDLSTVDQRLLRHGAPDATVSMHVSVKGNTVIRA
ncbi:hypothetical protein ABZT43_31455 [Streptomyces sp. NPDC005349]|uniref:hypothetical protein n=1 Tax=Streptomyces sp. NPDC005349 TaxID=3157037 RepID=UPI0033A45109